MPHLFANGKAVRGDFIVSMTERTDLAPIPATLEAVFRYDEVLAADVGEGAILNAGRAFTEFRVMKSVVDFGAGGEQAGRPTGLIHVWAYLKSVHAVSYLRRTAVVKERSTLAEAYSACDARASIQSDFQIARFSCLVGQVPTLMIARVAQEEGGAIYWNGRSLVFGRLHEMVRREPKLSVPANMVRTVGSEFQERHEVPWFFSVGPTGAIVHGNRDNARAAEYTPQKDERVLRNMTRCLIHRGTLTGVLRQDLNAGDVIAVDKKPHVIVTAAHQVANDTDGSGNDTKSKFWLSEVVQ